jgi:DNA-binding transcriptional regulator of glucitol operon
VAAGQGAHRNLRLHITIAVVVPGFFALGWWQLTRALSGNALSWAYVFEWPLFAGYAVYMWWKLIHDESPVPRRATSRAQEAKQEARAMAEDEELAAYNEYLAALNVSDRAKGQ